MDTCQSFDINLIVTDNNTCSDTVDINYYVNCNPTADFTWRHRSVKDYLLHLWMKSLLPQVILKLFHGHGTLNDID